MKSSSETKSLVLTITLSNQIKKILTQEKLGDCKYTRLNPREDFFEI